MKRCLDLAAMVVQVDQLTDNEFNQMHELFGIWLFRTRDDYRNKEVLDAISALNVRSKITESKRKAYLR